jgi:hypothetical protein
MRVQLSTWQPFSSTHVRETWFQMYPNAQLHDQLVGLVKLHEPGLACGMLAQGLFETHGSTTARTDSRHSD